jgi:hypothetical protein
MTLALSKPGASRAMFKVSVTSLDFKIIDYIGLDSLPNSFLFSMCRCYAAGQAKYLNCLGRPDPFGRANSFFIVVFKRIFEILVQPAEIAEGIA